MGKILSFHEFLNEDNILMKTLGGIISGQIDPKSGKAFLPKELRKDQEGTSSSDDATPGESRLRKRGEYTPSSDYEIAPGNDDFTLYLQHQQGVAGATSIIKALKGTGKLHPDTARINMLSNVPSDKPQVKADIKAALQAGDQKTAAALFVNAWKEKWNSFSKKSKEAIDKPQNAQAKEAILKASEKYEVPFDFAVTVAMIESGLDPKAGNQRYKGLFAMDPNQTYGGLVTPMGSNWSDPEINADNGVKLLRRDIVQFKKHLGSDLASLDLSKWAKDLA